MNINSDLIIYTKDKKIKVLEFEESKISHQDLISDGWQHTATLVACMWIEHLHNTSKNWNKDIRSLSKITNKQPKP